MSDPLVPPTTPSPVTPPSPASPGLPALSPTTEGHPQSANPYAAHGYGSYPGYQPAGQPMPAAARPQRNGLAIAALVISILALLGVIGLFVVGALAANGPAGPSTAALSGRVTTSDGGVSGTDLEQALTQAITDDQGSVDQILCPPRSKVGQGLVTVCHGSVDGGGWTGVVVFEDDSGQFILDEL